LIGIILGGATSQLHAQEQADVHPYLTSKYVLDLGVYFPERELTLSVDGPAIPGSPDDIDFEAQFGVKKSDELFSLNFGWRFGEKWELQGQYFKAKESAQKVLEEEVEWNDVIFAPGTGVGVGQEFELVRMFFARKFESRNHHHFGIGAGLHILEIGAFIEGTAIIVGGGSEFRRESVSVTAPLPNIGAWYMYSASPKWLFKARLDWLSASIDDYSGTMINASIGVNYQLFEHFGLGLSYNDFELDLGVKRSDWKGDVEILYRGLYANVSFYW
jgi:hypothetical protein